MNKKLFTLLLVALMASLASFGQQDDKSVLATYKNYTFYNGIMGSDHIPVWGDNVGNLIRSQFIMPREDLTAIRFGEIVRLTFYSRRQGAQNISWGNAVFQVYLAEVDFTEFNDQSFYDWESMTLVYTGPISISNYGMVITIPSNSYFIYEGRDLMVGIKQVAAGTSNYANFLGISRESKTALYASGSGTIGTQEAFLPKTQIRIRVHEAPLCIRPRGLYLTNCGGTSAEINWTHEEGQTAWQLVYSTDASFNPDDVTPIEINEHPYTLEGLSPETDYYVYIRTNCGDDGYSEWSDKFSFTTTVSCPAPSNLQLISQDGSSAEIGWTGQSSDYTLRYKNNAENDGEILLSCGFENGLPSNWSRVDNDGDSRGWRLDNGGYTAFEGNSCMYSDCYYNYQFLHPDDWLITPSVELGGTVTFYAKGRLHFSLPCTEHFAVYVSTTNTSVGSFTQISPEFVTTGDYQLYSVDLSGYQGLGYIAIRHFNSMNTSSLCIDDFTVYSEPSTWSEIEGVSSNPFTLDGLSEKSHYEVQVKSVCSTEETSEWSESLFFHTTSDCSHSVVVDIEHPFFEGFESSVFAPPCWTANENYYHYKWEQYVSPNDIGSGNHEFNHTGVCCAGTDFYGPVELVMPEVQIVGNHATLSFWVRNVIRDGGGHNYVFISTNHGNSYSQLWYSLPNSEAWTPITISLDSYVNQNVVIKFRFESDYSHRWFLDDVKITVPYDKVFATTGNWNVANNWSPSGVPTSSQNVLINAAATIPNGCVAEANVVKIGTGSLAIADGGQLKHNNSGVNANVQKAITGYNNGSGKWYLIATPIERNHYPTNVTGLIPTNNTNYDLYRFDQSEGIEWRNYKQGEIRYLQNSVGYLYAKKTSTNIQFAGELVPSQDDVQVALGCQQDHPEYESRGWNLIGNPFACNAYLLGNTNFYRMNDNGTGLILANGAIAPCEGVFVKATAPGQSATFTRTAPAGSGNQLDFNLSDVNGQMIDRARIYLNSTQTTDKFSLFANSTKLYISNEGRDYAAFGTESSGEIPVNFKSSEDGKYCISLDSDVNMSYLHLIDNLTGADVDLRKTPTYSFTSKTTDYASRFKVVFMAESDGNEDSFAFVNNGKLIVLDSDQEATLQVIDMTGRILSSERISGSCMMPLNYTPGVYVLRLIEGNEVRTQKIVLGRN